MEFVATLFVKAYLTTLSLPPSSPSISISLSPSPFLSSLYNTPISLSVFHLSLSLSFSDFVFLTPLFTSFHTLPHSPMHLQKTSIDISQTSLSLSINIMSSNWNKLRFGFSRCRKFLSFSSHSILIQKLQKRYLSDSYPVCDVIRCQFY